jgi:hypothetical protein
MPIDAQPSWIRSSSRRALFFVRDSSHRQSEECDWWMGAGNVSFLALSAIKVDGNFQTFATEANG